MPSIFESFQKGKSQSDEFKKQFDESQSIVTAYEDNFVLKSPNSFFFTREVLRLSHKLGQMVEATQTRINARGSPSSVFSIVGPRQSGKSISAQQITNELNTKIGGNYAQYIGSNYLNWWDNADFRDTKIFFLDNIYPIWDQLDLESYEYLFNHSKYEKIIIVTILNTVEHYWLRLAQNSSRIKFFNQEPFEFRFKRSSIAEISEIIKLRSEILGKPEIWSPKVLSVIGILSLGLPGLALWLVRNIITYKESQETWHDITPLDVLKIAQYLDFKPALKLVGEHNVSQEEYSFSKVFWPILEPLKEIVDRSKSQLIQSLSAIKKPTKSWKSLLEEMLILTQQNGTIKRTELQERTGVKESSLTYQCNQLVKEKIIQYSKEGREVFYQLRSPVKEALELTFFG